MKHVDISIILPTYNEAGNIVRLINHIKNVCNKYHISAEIIVVDDNSPDGTSTLVKNTFKRNQIKLFTRTRYRGLATAILFGIRKSTGTFVVVMDTDFNHDPKEIPVMYKLLKRYDLVIGSRFVKNGGMENHLRQELSRMFNIYLRLLLGHGVKDNLSGYFAINRSLLTRLPLTRICYGFGDYFIRLIYVIDKKKYLITETPVFYKNRAYGISKSRFIPMFLTYSLSSLKLRFGKI